MTNIILMASGLGTRMQPLTLETPKPLVTVNNKPMIETIIDEMRRGNFSFLILAVGIAQLIVMWRKRK